MNYLTFGNLQFRPLLKNFFQTFHIDLKNKSGGKKPFVSVGIARLVLLFIEACSIHFQRQKRFKMVASRQLWIPFYKGIVRQRERGLGALAQCIGRTTFPFLGKYIVPAAKREGADMLDFAALEIADVVDGQKISRQLQRVWEGKL